MLLDELEQLFAIKKYDEARACFEKASEMGDISAILKTMVIQMYFE